MQSTEDNVKELIRPTKVLIVDDEQYARTVIRTLLGLVGITNVHDAIDGASGLEAIAKIQPDVVLLDWDMPGIDGTKFTRWVRSPGRFPFPDVPIIMLTSHGEASRVLEAVRLGIHEFLLKPVSSRALLTRIMSVLTKPRPMVQCGDFYGPAPRELSSYRPDAESFDLHADRVVELRPNLTLLLR